MKQTAHPDLIAAQLRLEREGIDAGISRYREALQRDPSACSPAQTLLRQVMPPLVEALDMWRAEINVSGPGRDKGVLMTLVEFESPVLALVTLQALMSSAMRPDGSGAGTLQVARAVAARLESLDQLAELRKAAPDDAKRVEKRLPKYNSDRERIAFVRTAAEGVKAKVVKWGQAERLRAGLTLVTLAVDVAGLFELYEIPGTGHARSRAQQGIRPTQQVRAWFDAANARCELLDPPRFPMICPPRDWSTPWDGGFLTPSLRQCIIKTDDRAYLDELETWDMPEVYRAVNALQGTRWEINEFVLMVATACWDGDIPSTALPPKTLEPLPAKPWAEGEEPNPEVLKAWKKLAAPVHQRNHRSAAKRASVAGKLWTAEKMIALGHPFHFVYALDWRGRAYPVAGVLTPQGDDLSKGLLRFAEGVPLGDDGAYWLAVHLANTFGVDKVSFAERIQWVEDNEDQILRCAADPLVHREWERADSPFCHLAACKEWARLHLWIDAGAAQGDFRSHLPIAFDGACNGLQNFSALLLDPVGGAATGLVPTDSPSDIYTRVKEKSEEILRGLAAQGDEVAERWVGKLTRNLVKRNTMTTPYGVTRSGMTSQVREILDEIAPELRGDAAFLAGVNYEAVGAVVIAARQAMDWLKAAAKVAAQAGVGVKWVTPMGLLVRQWYERMTDEQRDVTVLGRRWSPVARRGTGELHSGKQTLGISPNFIHSLDAAHLQRTVLMAHAEGLVDFAMIHDSYGVHAGHSSRLRDILRQAFVDQYSNPVLKWLRDEIVDSLPEELRDQVPPLPPMGTLDLRGVLSSEYFFA